MNEELRRLIQDNLDLDKRIDELNKKIEDAFVYVNKIDIVGLEKKVHDAAIMKSD